MVFHHYPSLDAYPIASPQVKDTWLENQGDFLGGSSYLLVLYTTEFSGITFGEGCCTNILVGG